MRDTDWGIVASWAAVLLVAAAAWIGVFLLAGLRATVLVLGTTCAFGFLAICREMWREANAIKDDDD